MPDITFELDEFTQAARRFSDAHSTGQAIKRDLAAARVPDGMFGRVPWLSDQLAAPYQEHFAACTDSLSSAVESLDKLSDSMLSVRRAYESMESAHAKAADHINSELVEN